MSRLSAVRERLRPKLRTPRLTREQFTRSALGVSVVAAVLLASYGVGYRSSETLLSGVGAYLQRGDTVVHVNAESGTEDAEAARKLATGKERLQVVQVGPDSVWVVNTESGEVWRLPTRSMKPEKVGDKGAKGAEKPDVVAGGGKAYLVDRDNKKLTSLDARPDKRRDIPTPAPVDVAVVDSSGTAWALARATGELYQVSGGVLRHRVKVAGPGEKAQLTLAGGRPVVYRPTRGKVATYGSEGLVRSYNLPPVDQPVLVPTSPVAAPVLVAVVKGTAEVYSVDLRTGKVSTTQLNGHEDSTFGPPAVLGRYVYVPDQTLRQVLLLDVHTLRLHDHVAVPGGTDEFDVFVRDNRVWVNDPYAPTMLVFDRQGRPTEVDRSGKTVNESTRDPIAPDPPKGHSDRPAPPDAAPPAAAPPVAPAPPKPSAPKVSVPDVVGMEKGRACDVVERADLVCRYVSRQDQNGDTNEVLETDPEAGSKVGKGSTVTIVYAGPAVVPDVVGMSVEDACTTIEKARFRCAKDAQGVANSPAEVNKVYGQTPAKDTPMTTGSPVTVNYPVPGWIKVPQVTGSDPNTACQTIQSWGLVCAPNPDEVTWQPNVVHYQNVPAGTAVQTGSQVGVLYQDNSPVILDRWKLHGTETRFMAPRGTAPPPGDWREQTEMGGVYTSPDQVPGLVWVYRFKCSKDCGDPDRDLEYLFQRSTNPRGPQWAYEGPAFACFNPDGTAPDGTRPLEAMYSDTRKAWAYAVRGTGEWDFYRQADHGAYDYKFTICNVWFGVPGYRPNG